MRQILQNMHRSPDYLIRAIRRHRLHHSQQPFCVHLSSVRPEGIYISLLTSSRRRRLLFCRTSSCLPTGVLCLLCRIVIITRHVLPPGFRRWSLCGSPLGSFGLFQYVCFECLFLETLGLVFGQNLDDQPTSTIMQLTASNSLSSVSGLFGLLLARAWRGSAGPSEL